MRRTIEAPSAGVAAMIILGLGQGALATVRALEWVGIGIDLSGRGAILLPLVGGLALARGLLVAGVALLYAGFAWGALTGAGWAWWLGLGAALLNLFLVVNAVAGGARLIEALPWAVVPVILVLYLLSPAGRRALRR